MADESTTMAVDGSTKMGIGNSGKTKVEVNEVESQMSKFKVRNFLLFSKNWLLD